MPLADANAVPTTLTPEEARVAIAQVSSLITSRAPPETIFTEACRQFKEPALTCMGIVNGNQLAGVYVRLPQEVLSGPMLLPVFASTGAEGSQLVTRFYHIKDLVTDKSLRLTPMHVAFVQAAKQAALHLGVEFNETRAMNMVNNVLDEVKDAIDKVEDKVEDAM